MSLKNKQEESAISPMLKLLESSNSPPFMLSIAQFILVPSTKSSDADYDSRSLKLRLRAFLYEMLRLDPFRACYILGY